MFAGPEGQGPAGRGHPAAPQPRAVAGGPLAPSPGSFSGSARARKLVSRRPLPRLPGAPPLTLRIHVPQLRGPGPEPSAPPPPPFGLLASPAVSSSLRHAARSLVALATPGDGEGIGAERRRGGASGEGAGPYSCACARGGLAEGRREPGTKPRRTRCACRAQNSYAVPSPTVGRRVSGTPRRLSTSARERAPGVRVGVGAGFPRPGCEHQQVPADRCWGEEGPHWRPQRSPAQCVLEVSPGGPGP